MVSWSLSILCPSKGHEHMTENPQASSSIEWSGSQPRRKKLNHFSNTLRNSLCQNTTTHLRNLPGLVVTFTFKKWSSNEETMKYSLPPAHFSFLPPSTHPFAITKNTFIEREKWGSNWTLKWWVKALYPMRYYSLWKTPGSVKTGINGDNNMLSTIQTIVWECVYLDESVSTALKQSVTVKAKDLSLAAS